MESGQVYQYGKLPALQEMTSQYGKLPVREVVRMGGGIFGAADYVFSYADSRYHLPVDPITDTFFDSEHRTSDGGLRAVAIDQRV